MRRTLIKVLAVAAFGSLGMLVTGSRRPVGVGLVPVAAAGVSECRERCRDKREACITGCSSRGANADCSGACYRDWDECNKDCDASAR